MHSTMPDCTCHNPNIASCLQRPSACSTDTAAVKVGLSTCHGRELMCQLVYRLDVIWSCFACLWPLLSAAHSFQDHNPSRHHAGVQARSTVHGRRGHLCNSNQTSVTFWSARWSLELQWSQRSNQDKYSFLFHWLISAPFNRYNYSSPYAQRPAVLPISTSSHDTVIVHIAQPSVNRRSCPCSFPSCPGTSIPIYHQFQESSAQKQVHLHKWHGVMDRR